MGEQVWEGTHTVACIRHGVSPVPDPGTSARNCPEKARE